MSYKALTPLCALLMLGTASCLKDNDEPDFKDWKERNEQYVQQAEAETKDGVKTYQRFEPWWSPNGFVLMHWHNDRALTQDNLIPLDNSTLNIKYELRDIDGKVLDSSYASTAYGDSIYRVMPRETVTGFRTGLTLMHVGDSVTMVMPYQSGYGSASKGSVLPYSTLIFDVKLKSIYRYETPN